MQSRLFQIIKGGILATAVMTLVMLMAPLMGLPRMPIGDMLANFMHLPSALGWLAHFMIGTILAAEYVLFFGPALKVNRILAGTLYALIPFVLAQTMVMPIMGAGFFSIHTPAPFLMVMGSLIGHLVYGASLGYFTNVQNQNVQQLSKASA